MEHRDLISRIANASKARGLAWVNVRQGTKHEIWQCGTTRVSIPRHREVNELTAEGIMQDLESELGKEWWT